MENSATTYADRAVSRGIEAGDKVALSCPNLPYFAIAYLGILKAGANVREHGQDRDAWDTVARSRSPGPRCGRAGMR